jgi:hypothetical protein
VKAGDRRGCIAGRAAADKPVVAREGLGDRVHSKIWNDDFDVLELGRFVGATGGRGVLLRKEAIDPSETQSGRLR